MLRFATGQEIVGEKFFKVRKKSGSFILRQGKLRSINTINTIDLSRREKIFWATVISTIFFLNEEGKFVENLLVLINE